MKVIEDVLLKRTSVRRYEREKIEPEKLDLIYRAIASTPTSYNGQQYSVIAVEDQEKKELLYEIIGQKQIKTSAVFLVFCVDFNKVSLLAKAKELDFPRIQDKMDGVMIGLIDAALAMQNAVVAAQSLGLGSCCIGYARTADPARRSFTASEGGVCRLQTLYRLSSGDSRSETETAFIGFDT